MKKIFLFLLTAIFVLEGVAQSVFTVKSGEKTYSFPLTSEISVTDDALWVPDTIVQRDTLRDTVTLAPTYKTRLNLARINLDGSGYNNGTKILMKQIGDYKWSARIPGRAGHKFNFLLNVNLRDEPVPGFTTIPWFMHIGYAEVGKTKLTSAGTIYGMNENGKQTAMFETTDFGTDSVEIIMLEDTAKYTTPTSRNLNGTFYVLTDTIVNRADTVTTAPTYKTRVRNGMAIVNIDGSGDSNGTRIFLKPVADYTWQAMIPGRAGHTLNFYFNLNSRDEPAPGFTTISFYTHVGMALENNATMASAGRIYNKYATEGSTAKFQTADFGCDSVRLVFVEDSAAYYSKTDKSTYLDHGTYYILSDSIIGGREVIERHDTVSYYYYPLTVLSTADSMGSVKGSGVYRSGTSVEVSATAADGYDFERWSDGSTEAKRTFTVSGIDTLTAYFKKYVAPATWTYDEMYLNVSNATTYMNEYQAMTKGATVDTWEWEGTFDNEVTCSFYSGKSWSVPYWGIGTWGDPYEESGTCKRDGGDMRIPAGTYKITFNVSRLTYTVTKE